MYIFIYKIEIIYWHGSARISARNLISLYLFLHFCILKIKFFKVFNIATLYKLARINFYRYFAYLFSLPMDCKNPIDRNFSEFNFCP